jgi:hypothetical protein
LEPLNFLRSNSFATKLLMTYTQRGGTVFLSETIAESVKQVLLEKKSLELDPKLIAKEMNIEIKDVEKRSEVLENKEIRKVFDESKFNI